jgi:predicted N-acetyltransferase YhbS
LEYENNICGTIACVIFDNFVYIGNLVVDNDHQRKGLGSIMIQHCIANTRKPIYLVCFPALQHFYYRLGFVEAEPSSIPSELCKFSKNTRLHLMVLN